TNCYLIFQVGAFAAAFLCCHFSLPTTYKFFFRQAHLGLDFLFAGSNTVILHSCCIVILLTYAFQIVHI
ncbi:MAG: hypothetical protein ACI3XZ_05865, partial [Butyricicoccus sp.]